MQALARAARSSLRPVGQSVRRMSGALSQEEEVKQMSLWRVVTVLGAFSWFEGTGRGSFFLLTPSLLRGGTAGRPAARWAQGWVCVA